MNRTPLLQATAPQCMKTILASAGVAFVDISYSTEGAVLRTEKEFTQDLNPKQTALWGTTCSRLAPTSNIEWRASGGTTPTCIFRQYPEVPDDWGAFVLVTDGEVHETEVRRLSAVAHKTAHLPTILAIAVEFLPQTIARCNVSVLYSHFVAAQTAALIVVHGERLHVIKAKGEWEDAFGDLPDLQEHTQFSEFPCIDVNALHALSARRKTLQPANTIRLTSGGKDRWLHLDLLLQTTDVGGVREEISDSEMEDVVRMCNSNGRLGEVRKWLDLLSASLNARVATLVDTLVDISDAAPPTDITSLLSSLRLATDDAERDKIRNQLMTGQAAVANASVSAANEARSTMRDARAFVGRALQAVTELQKAGMSATVLGRLSNRAQRADVVRSHDEPLTSFDLDGAPRAECNVMLEPGAVAILIRKVPERFVEDNTADFAIDFPLCTAANSANDVFTPDILGISDGTADKIEESQVSVLAREQTVVAIPIVSLADARNQAAMFRRLCRAFTNGLKLGHVWQIALAAITQAMETKAWASDTQPIGELLHFLGSEIMTHVLIRQGSRLAPHRATLISAAYAECIDKNDFLRDYPLNGTVTCAVALLRWTSTPPAKILACIRVRAHLAIAQQHREWIRAADRVNFAACSPAALWRSIFDVRVGTSGALVPIAGTHQIPTSWHGVLRHESVAQLARFVAFANDPSLKTADDLIVPGMAIVIRAVLATIAHPHISAARACELPLGFHPAVAPEWEPSLVGLTTSDCAKHTLAEWLTWARTPMHPLPPFATPYGPSLIFFYHGRFSGGMVTNMTDGFEWSAVGDESDDDRFERLASHVRMVRKQLLHVEYDYSADGTFVRDKTTSSPLHRAMSDVWAENENLTPLSGEFVAAVVQRIVDRGLGNRANDCLEHDVSMLCHSLARFNRPLPSFLPGRFNESRSVAARLKLELGGRAITEMRAPPPIWVPRDDLRDMLKAADLARKAILDKHAARASTPRAVEVANVKPFNSNQLSHALTKILRHSADQHKLPVRDDGYISLDRVLGVPLFEDRGVTRDDVLALVETDSKLRYGVTDDEEGKLLIRANQGHSLACVLEGKLLTEVRDANELRICIHGTSMSAWNVIQKTSIDAMQRNSIQMAVGLPGDKTVVSGVRSTVDVLIYVDVARAMERGIRFFRSANGVICSPGPIPAACFAQVTRRVDGESLIGTSFA